VTAASDAYIKRLKVVLHPERKWMGPVIATVWKRFRRQEN
jgi:hypothetical protein